MTGNGTLQIDGKTIPIRDERNILELARRAGIDIPSFCYHSELSIYGACRLCMVDIEGMGVVASCSTAPAPGMVIRTTTPEILKMRRITLELYLAHHDQSCPTCSKSAACRLKELARRLDVQTVRFPNVGGHKEPDMSSPALVRDPNKCVLCGDCVRVCAEVQGIGALAFSHRGHEVTVEPAFGKGLGAGECVSCGQCAAVCPVGAITIRSEVDKVWDALYNPDITVVAQIAPAVRVALGEQFGLEPGSVATGQLVAALKHMGFDQVYDTSFAADLTVLEEAEEFLARKEKGEHLPIFTSCCPAWVTWAEQFCPDVLDHLSSCRSPQQMFGSLAKHALPDMLKVEKENLMVVSIMPCTAKKAEAQQDKYNHDGIRDVDAVLTTQEVAHMVEMCGIGFTALSPESMDLPMGFKTGAGILFGAAGGVSEAVARYVGNKVSPGECASCELAGTDEGKGIREVTLHVGETDVRMALVYGLANARTIARQVQQGECNYDIVEVMACPGGCVGGAGQPVADNPAVRQKRAMGLRNTDKMLQLHSSQENPMVADMYKKFLGEIGGQKAHELLHTHYHHRERIKDERLALLASGNDEAISVKVCIGTNCYLKGSQDLLHKLIRHVEENGLNHRVDVEATFCFERCDKGPVASVNNTIVEHATLQNMIAALQTALRQQENDHHDYAGTTGGTGRIHQ